jgi:hypothetical protein
MVVFSLMVGGLKIWDFLFVERFQYIQFGFTNCLIFASLENTTVDPRPVWIDVGRKRQIAQV